MTQGVFVAMLGSEESPAIAGDRHCAGRRGPVSACSAMTIWTRRLGMPASEAFEEDQRLIGLRSQLLHVYLSQPLDVAAPFVAKPGITVGLVDTITDVEDLLDGRLDLLDRAELFSRGALITAARGRP